MIEVEFARGSFLQELAAAMTKKLVQTDLNLEGLVGVFLVKSLLLVFDERDLLVGCFCRQDIAEGNIFEAKVLPDIVVVGDVDSCGDTAQSLKEVRKQ